MKHLDLARANYSCVNYCDLPVPEYNIRHHVVWGCGGSDVIKTLQWQTFVFEGEVLEKFRIAAKATFDNAPTMVLMVRDLERQNQWVPISGKHMHESNTIQLIHIMLDGGTKKLDSHLYMSFDREGVKKAFPEFAGYELHGIVSLGIGAERNLADYDKRMFVRAPRYCR